MTRCGHWIDNGYFSLSHNQWDFDTVSSSQPIVQYGADRTWDMYPQVQASFQARDCQRAALFLRQ